ncbi:MAG: hypothetical protein ABIE22_02415 [archaeon]
MSLQRAIINCERCYAITHTIGYEVQDIGNEDDGRDLANLQPDEAYHARNEAMRALEDETNADFYMFDMGVKGSQSPGADNRKFLVELINECVHCDYSEARIAKKGREVIGGDGK